MKPVIVLLWFQLCVAGKEQLTMNIGGLFHEGDNESEMAFTYAVARYNMYHSEIGYKTKKWIVSRTDAFATSKIVCNMTSSDKGLVAIFGPPSPKTASMVQSICSKFELPHIQTTLSSSIPYGQQTVLNFYPDHDLLSRALGTIVEHLHWKSYAIVYEDNESLARLREVLRIVNVNDNPVLIRQLGDGPDYRPLLKEVKNSTVSKVILDCSTDKILDVLRQAAEIDLLNNFYNYFLTNLDAQTLDFKSLNTSTNITIIRLFDPNSLLLRNAIHDWEQGERNSRRYVTILPEKVKTESVLMYDAVTFFAATVPELHLTESIITEPLFCDIDMKWSGGLRISNFLKIKQRPDLITGPIRFNEHGRRVDFNLEIAEIVDGKIEKTATWSPLKPDSLIVTRSASKQLQHVVEHLQKATVIVSSRLGPPYLREVVPKDGEILEGNDRYEGYSKDLIYLIAKELKFTFKIVLTEDGSYDGLIKDLLEKKAHLAICDLTINHQRRSVVDFSSPFMNLGISILYSKTPQIDANKFAFMKVFGFEVWSYTATLFLTVSVLLYFTARMAPGDWENPHPCNQSPDELENIWDIKNSLWVNLGSIMTQGSDILPKGISSRMLVSMWWFFSLIMTSSYTANLAAFLTKTQMTSSIDGIEDLIKQTRVKYGTVDGGSTQTFFRESNFTTNARAWTNMEQTKPSAFEKTNADGVKRVLTTKNQGYAFFMESSTLEYEVEKNCNLKQVGRHLDSKSYGIAMPMNSNYRDAISNVILKLSENGTLADLKKKWWKQKVDIEVPCDSTNTEASNTGDLKLKNVGGVFILLGLGIALSFFLALLDFLWTARKTAIAEHVSCFEAILIELKFASMVWITEKRVKRTPSESTLSSRAASESRRKSAGSFMRLDSFDRASVKRE